MSELNTSAIWDEPEALSEYERMRDEKRAWLGRLTFDCLNLKCQGDRAVCSAGHNLGLARDGSLPLLRVLKGYTAAICRECTEYEIEEEIDGNSS